MSIPKRLFKYTSKFGVDVVRNLQLKVTPPTELNDAFELAGYVLPVKEDHIAHLIQTTDPRQIYESMKSAGEQMGSYEEFLASLDTVAPAVIGHGSEQFKKEYDSLFKEHVDRMSKTGGIVCLSENENEPLMWAHYADSHQGILIEFDFEHIYFKDFSLFGRVCYSSERVPFDPNVMNDSYADDFPLKLIRTKFFKWSYEMEWRGAYLLSDCERKYSKDGKPLYFTAIPPNLITRIVLGDRCPKTVETEIRELIVARGLPIQFQRAVHHDTEFVLEYRDISL